MKQGCEACNAACLTKIPDTCVRWGSNDIDALGIKQGDFYNDIMPMLANKFLEFLNTQIDVSITNDGTLGSNTNTLPVLKAIQQIADKMNKLSSKDITLDGVYTGLSSEALSNDAGKLLNRFGTFYVSQETSGSSVGFDLTPATTDLPSGYVLAKTNVIITGSKKQGNNVITNTDLQSFASNVSNDRFPLNAEVTIRVNTPNGNVDLVNNLTIQSPITTNSQFKLDVKDRSKTAGDNLKLNEFADLISNQVLQHKTDIAQFKNIDIKCTDNVKFANTDIRTIATTLVNKVDSLIKTTNDLSKVTYDNAGSTISGTPDKILSTVGTNLNNNTTEIEKIKSDLQTIKDALNQLNSDNPITLLTKGGSLVSGVTVGGGDSSGGGCPSGNCG